MTKQHFTAIAAILKANNAERTLAYELANYFATTNPNFNRERFLEACRNS